MSAKKKPPAKKTKAAKKKATPPPRDRELELHREELAAQNEEMRETNAELAAARERYARLYDVAPVGYFTLDGERRIVEANFMAGELVGVERRMLFGRTFDDLVVPGARDAFRRFMRGAAGEATHLVHDTVLDAPTGPLPVHVEGAVLEAAGFRRSQVLLCVSDDRPRRRLEEQRRTLDVQIAETDRLDSLDVLAARVAHDFNNVLAVVLTCAELALRDLKDSSAKSAILEVRSAAERAAELSRQMLAYTGRARVESQDVDVSSLIASIQPLLRAGVGTAAELEVDLGRDVPFVVGDPVQLRQVIVNLVVNASEAIGTRGGTVTVRTRATADDVSIEVADDGPGMTEDTRRHAFDPFFSTKRDRRGLGLAVVYGHVRAHGGGVTVKSEVGRGTTFTVTLPARRPTRSAEQEESRGTVLVVDDDRGMRDAIARCLGHLGFEVVLARDGREGVENVKRDGDSYGLVLLDLMMPVMDGRTALREMLALRSDLRVVVMSGYADATSVEALPGAAAFLAKPFDLAALERAVMAALPARG